jgi:hypothetical protein
METSITSMGERKKIAVVRREKQKAEVLLT